MGKDRGKESHLCRSKSWIDVLSPPPLLVESMI